MKFQEKIVFVVLLSIVSIKLFSTTQTPVVNQKTLNDAKGNRDSSGTSELRELLKNDDILYMSRDEIKWRLGVPDSGSILRMPEIVNEFVSMTPLFHTETYGLVHSLCGNACVDVELLYFSDKVVAYRQNDYLFDGPWVCVKTFRLQ